ncbi:hypothetical protein NKR19_g1475 [Coniochaeta hoffmannii]|uniref:Uncharacterized protein n=1 Tax=Coniochaeta hoffmannii TaxID=91930 RepID=A0AA38SCG1_9PEZI|nr:hypothetical protein NKR19_g1475 [Coniochaeta hoffmannii]
MKSLSALVLTAGLVSAVSVAPSPVANEASSNGQAESIANIFNSSVGLNGSQIDSASPNFDPASLNLNNLGGVNLGQVDFSNQDSIASAILSMLNVLCAGNLFDVNSILDLGLNNDLELFLELVQLMQLEQLGFLNVFDIQSLLGSGFGSGFSSGFGSSLVGTSNSNAFNLGFFKRAVSERRKTMKRTRLRRSPTKTKRQCQANVADPNAAAGFAPGVVAPEASAAPDVAAPPAASAAPEAAPAAEPAAAPAAAAPEDDGESLSDFTR